MVGQMLKWSGDSGSNDFAALIQNGHLIVVHTRTCLVYSRNKSMDRNPVNEDHTYNSLWVSAPKYKGTLLE